MSAQHCINIGSMYRVCIRISCHNSLRRQVEDSPVVFSMRSWVCTVPYIRLPQLYSFLGHGSVPCLTLYFPSRILSQIMGLYRPLHQISLVVFSIRSWVCIFPYIRLPQLYPFSGHGSVSSLTLYFPSRILSQIISLYRPLHQISLVVFSLRSWVCTVPYIRLTQSYSQSGHGSASSLTLYFPSRILSQIMGLYRPLHQISLVVFSIRSWVCIVPYIRLFQSYSQLGHGSVSSLTSALPSHILNQVFGPHRPL